MLERACEEAGPQGVLVLGLDQQDAREAAREFLAEYRISYPNVRESGREVASDYGATGLPETFFISADGRIVGHVIGAADDDQLSRGIAAARTGRPVSLGGRPAGHLLDGLEEAQAEPVEERLTSTLMRTSSSVRTSAPIAIRTSPAPTGTTA